MGTSLFIDFDVSSPGLRCSVRLPFLDVGGRLAVRVRNKLTVFSPNMWRDEAAWLADTGLLRVFRDFDGFLPMTGGGVTWLEMLRAGGDVNGNDACGAP